MAPRRHLVVEQPANFRPHDHVVWRGENSTDLDYLAITAFAGAVRRNERMMFVSDEPFDSGLGRLRNVDRLIERGTIALVPTAVAYPQELAGNPAGQMEVFDTALENALEDGYSGVCVVADNTPFVGEDDASFERWLAWEELTDRFQADRPIVGVCYFDVRRVPPNRIADLTAIHPVLSPDFAPPPFRVFSDAGMIRAIGSLDRWTSDRLVRALRNAPTDGELVLDISEVEFVDQHALAALQELASEDELPIRILGAGEQVRRLWEQLEPLAPVLRFV